MPTNPTYKALAQEGESKMYKAPDGPRVRIFGWGTEYWVRVIPDFPGSGSFVSVIQLHRLNGPAVTSVDGKIRRWYVNNKLHRVGGFAFEFDDAVDPMEAGEYWLNGEQYDEKEYWLECLRSGLIDEDDARALSSIL